MAACGQRLVHTVVLFPCLPSRVSQSIIYYLVHSPKLSTWLKDAAVQEALQSYTKWHHIERDPQVFSVKIDEDYVHCLQGVTRASFCNVYLEWIQHCAGKMETVRHLKDQYVRFRASVINGKHQKLITIIKVHFAITKKSHTEKMNCVIVLMILLLVEVSSVFL